MTLAESPGGSYRGEPGYVDGAGVVCRARPPAITMRRMSGCDPAGEEMGDRVHSREGRSPWPDASERDVPLAEEEPRHAVRDHGRLDAVLEQLPGGETRALKERSGLVGQDTDALARLLRGPHHTEGRSVAGCGQCAGIAVSEDA